MKVSEEAAAKTCWLAISVFKFYVDKTNFWNVN